MAKWHFRGLFSYNPRKYIREKFLLFNPQKFPLSKLIHNTVNDISVVNIIVYANKYTRMSLTYFVLIHTMTHVHTYVCMYIVSKNQ